MAWRRKSWTLLFSGWRSTAFVRFPLASPKKSQKSPAEATASCFSICASMATWKCNGSPPSISEQSDRHPGPGQAGLGDQPLHGQWDFLHLYRSVGGLEYSAVAHAGQDEYRRPATSSSALYAMPDISRAAGPDPKFSSATMTGHGAHRGRSIAVTPNDNLDYFGLTVNVAARVQSLAEAGQWMPQVLRRHWCPSWRNFFERNEIRRAEPNSGCTRRGAYSSYRTTIRCWSRFCA